MSASDTLTQIQTLLGMKPKEEPKKLELEMQKLENGAVIEAEVFETGQDVFLVQDDERIPIPIGEYEMESGMILVVAEEGVISEIKAKEAEGEEEEMEAEYATKAELAEVKSMIEEVLSKLNASAEEPKKEPVKEEVKAELKKEELSKEEEFKHSPEKESDKQTLLAKIQQPTDPFSNVLKLMNY